MSNVQSVARAMAILRSLAGTEAGVSELAGRVELPKSTVSRLLATLHDLGAVSTTDDGYRVGPLITEIAAGTGHHVGLAALARPFLAELVEDVGEDAGVSVLDDDEVLYLEHVSAGAAVQLRDWTGERVPAHCVSSGLVLLAHTDEMTRERILGRALPRVTAQTMVAPARLRGRLARIVRRGTEWVYGEFIADINSVAAPVFDGSHRAVAALHVHGPSYRFPGADDPTRIAERVAEAAARLSSRIRR